MSILSRRVFKASAVGTAILPVAAHASTGLALGPLFFAAPTVLAGLPALYVLYKWMRQIPPQPEEFEFPQVHLLADIQDEEQQSADMHWLQIATRLGAAGAIVGALAGPQWAPDQGPALIVLDNGFASAPSWNATREQVKILIDRAEQGQNQILFLPLAPPSSGGTVALSSAMNAGEALRHLDTIKPEPWHADYAAASRALQAVDASAHQYSITWMTPGVAAPGHVEFAGTLMELGTTTLLQPEHPVYQLQEPETTDQGLVFTAQRLGEPSAKIREVLALAANDQVLARSSLEFVENEESAKATMKLDPPVRNQVERFILADGGHAGETVLMDEKWRRRPVGLITGLDTNKKSGPRDAAFFIEAALADQADLQSGPIERLLERKQSTLILTDDVPLNEADRLSLVDWVQKGGTLLRFAGPNLAEHALPGDDLVPMPLRRGGAAFAGAAGDSVALRAPEEGTPLEKIVLPSDVRIREMIHAVPTPGSDAQIWMRTATGSPFVTARALGSGHTILVHTSANPETSNLVLSGTFPELLRAVVDFSRGAASGLDKPAAPYRVLDASGQMRVPGPAVQPLTQDILDRSAIGPAHPPGLYGDSTIRRAFNLSASVPALKPFDSLPDQIVRKGYVSSHQDSNLSSWFYGAGFALLMVSMGWTLAQRRLIPGLKPVMR